MVLGVRGVPSKESPDAGVSPACFDPEKTKVRHSDAVHKDNDLKKKKIQSPRKLQSQPWSYSYLNKCRLARNKILT